MEFSDAARVKAANPPTPLVRGAFSRRGGVFMDSGLTMNMKIIVFPVNIDKFTGFFDKYLKTNGKEIEGVTDIISVGYENGFKQKKNILSNFFE